MTTADFPVGSSVFVRWYGKTLQGEVVPDDHRVPLFASMLHVRIPVQGTPVVAVFSPAHVSTTENPLQPVIPAPLPPAPPTLPAKETPADTSQAIRQYLEEHWDHELGHLRIDAIEEFYRLWRTSVAAKYGITIEEPPVPFVAIDPGSPDGDRSSEYVVDTHTGEILPELPKTAPVPAASPAGPTHKPAKKQLRSTGRIQYNDSIQTSLFD